MTEKPGQTSAADLAAKLRSVPVFADLSQEDLDWFIAHSQERRAAVGDIIVHEESPADAMIVVLEGEMRARRESGGADGPVFSSQTGAVTGVLPFSRMKTYTVTVRAVLPTHILVFPSSNFPELFTRMPDLSRRLVGLLTDRVREVTRNEQQREKLAALGKLSAGLAHELNNPSAAARRSAASLRDSLQRLRSAGRISTGPVDCAALANREEKIRAALKPAEFKDEFARVEREEAIQSWLETRCVDEAWKLAPLLADANLTDEHLESYAVDAGPALGPELTRFATLLEMDRVAEELEHSTSRISDLIAAIKEYSYMDQASLQEVDVQRSLETTLTIMNHKLKRGIHVQREFASDLPKVLAYGSELNQVWTNLIDNAADAMQDAGKLTVRAVRENDYLLVEIADTGPGIPPEVQSRIFEPFFTTKGVGEGTGLGLDIAHRIVRKIRGMITVKSQPGDTRFQVRIPIQSAIRPI
ncbi:MAG: ATP-binding protein [Candidatus Acidiferrum sp.]